MSMQETVLEKSSGAVWVSCCHHTKQYLMTKITWCVSHQRDNFLRWSSWLQPWCIGVISWLSNVLGTCWIYQWRALLSVICCWVCFGFVNHINNQIARYPWLQPHMFQLLLEMGWDEVPIDQKRHSIKYSPWHERFQMMSSSINAFSGFFQLWFHPPLCKRNTWAAILQSTFKDLELQSSFKHWGSKSMIRKATAMSNEDIFIWCSNIPQTTNENVIGNEPISPTTLSWIRLFLSFCPKLVCRSANRLHCILSKSSTQIIP